MFIVLEGIDGSGKTTLAKAVAERYPNTVFISRKSLPSEKSFVSEQMAKVHELMWTPNHGALDHLLPRDYWVFLQRTWYTLLQEFVIEPELQAGKNVICDGWFYKFWARLEQQNYQFEYLETIFSAVKKPDKVVLLDVSVEEVLRRKQDFKEYEMGSHLDGKEGSIEKMIHFQATTHKNLKNYARKYNWEALELPTSEINVNVERVLSQLV